MFYKRVGDIAFVQVEAIYFGVPIENFRKLVVRQVHSVRPPLRIANTAPKCFCQHMPSIGQVKPTHFINIYLTRIKILSGKLYNLASWVRDRNLICLIATSPDNEISLVDMWPLFNNCWSFYKLYTFLYTCLNFHIEVSGITSQPSIPINTIFGF